jgi:osmotically-inducible protein OsmY
MKHRIQGLVLAAVLVLGVVPAVAAGNENTNQPQALLQSDANLAGKVRHALVMYPWYTIWDDVHFTVSNGHVTLSGDVTQPYKKTDMDRLVRQIPGVTSVTSDLKVLPISNFDDRLRWQVARAIYSDPAFTQYAIMALPPVHIIVDNGHVTLTGVVATTFQKDIAGIRAAGAGLGFGPVVNNLQVEHPSAKKS